MRFSYYSTLVLGLWLTGQCWVSGEVFYPKPSISVHPSETVALGGDVKIHCKSDGYTQMEFYLLRQLSSDFELVRSKTADHDEVVFPIVNATPSEAGIYSCIYCHKTHTCQMWSDYSDSVNISIKGQDGQIPSDSAAERGAWVPPGGSDHPRALIWAGAAAGSLLLVLLLLLLAFILYRKRRRGSTANKRPQPLPMKETNLPLEPEAEEDPEDGVSYAELSHYSLKRQEAAKPASVPESCVYASVANGRTERGQ